jgi:hypothetical protein
MAIFVNFSYRLQEKKDARIFRCVKKYTVEYINEGT